jgi:ribosomal protein S18 acetylase RimI-like enzyme
MTPRIRNAAASDLPAILAIARSWPAHFVAQGIDAIAADFATANRVVAVAEDDRILGFAIWSVEVEEAELLWLAVHPTNSRQRVGTALVGEVVARAKGARSLIARTATLDSAIPGTALDGAEFSGTHEFFFSLGFAPVEVVRGYWSATNHAMTMRRELQP